MVVAVTLLVVAACGDDDAAGDGSTTATAGSSPAGTEPASTTPIPDEPGTGSTPIPDEPGTGTDVVVTAPETAPAGAPIMLPLTVTVGRGEVAWDEARLVVEVEGAVTAREDVDLGELTGGGSVVGELTVDIEPGTTEEPNHGAVNVTLELVADAEIVTARVTLLRLLADDEFVYLGFGGTGDLERARLQSLLEAGEITQQEFDEAYAATLEKVTGSVEVVDD